MQNLKNIGWTSLITGMIMMMMQIVPVLLSKWR